MRNKLTSIRDTVDFLKAEGEIYVSDKEIDPVCEVTGVAKAFEDGPAVLFENIKGYPGHRIMANAFGNRARLAKLFDVAAHSDLKWKVLEAIKTPIPPKIITKTAPCQEVVITRDIDVIGMMPVTQSIPNDPGRIIGGGITLLSGKKIGHCLAQRRTFFQGKDWASIAFNPTSHGEYWLLEARKNRSKVPLTINIGSPPAPLFVAAAGLIQTLMPVGCDELAIAGALQGSPVEICRAKTVDAYSIANAEWIIEGYMDTGQVVWESEEAKKTEGEGAPFFIEWLGYQGWARQTYKFQATAITHRETSPIFYASLANVLENRSRQGPFTEAAVLDMAERICPGLVKDVNVLDCMHGLAGVVIQIEKRRRRDEGYARNLILGAFVASTAMQLVIVVDEDINIYSADDLLWAIMTRADPKKDIVAFGRDETRTAGTSYKTEAPLAGGAGRVGFDATVPFDQKKLYYRGQHPRVDLRRWFSQEQIDRAKAQQGDYTRWLSENLY